MNCPLRAHLQVGTIIRLQRGSRNAQFCVQWNRPLGSNEQQVGIESLEPQNNFWGVDLSSEFDAKKDAQALMTALSRCSKVVR
jgi:hypothetical protein